MKKALITFVLLNLVASVAVITLITLSFLERNVLKAKAIELETTAQQISENLQWGDEVPWELAEDKKQLPFNLPQPIMAIELQDLEAALGDLIRFARQRQSQLTLRYDELVSTESTLAQTRQTLATRERELAAARNRQAQVTRTLAQTRADLQQTRGEVAVENRTKIGLESQIDVKNGNITDLNNTLASLEIDLETRIDERDNAQAQYERCRVGASGGQDANSKDVRGTRGKVLAVNQDWQYVVINKGMMHNMAPDMIALVHRGNEYVGKLKIMKVEDEVAVAAILPDSVVAVDGIAPGDTLFF